MRPNVADVVGNVADEHEGEAEQREGGFRVFVINGNEQQPRLCPAVRTRLTQDIGCGRSRARQEEMEKQWAESLPEQNPGITNWRGHEKTSVNWKCV